jgi:hypothetical protein
MMYIRTMWQEQNGAPEGHRNFGDEWGKLSITMKEAKPFSFSLLMDDHFLEYDGFGISYSSIGRGKAHRGPPREAHGRPSISLKKITETFQVLSKRIDSEMRDFVIAKIRESKGHPDF